MSPRAFERPATIALAGDRGWALDGLFVPTADEPAGGSLIAPPHPLYGGSMENPVVTELAHAAERAGIASLRFNWRGVGASGGEPTGDLDAAAEDYAAGLAFLAESVDAPLVACGYSFGAIAAARCCAGRTVPEVARVRRLLLVAPPPAGVTSELLESFSGRILIVAGEHDPIAPPGPLESLARAHERASFVLVEGADHFFGSGLRALARAVADWLGPRAG
ncbi:MAG: alpha/beta hydrolase [Myxococcota bacterium]